MFARDIHSFGEVVIGELSTSKAWGSWLLFALPLPLALWSGSVWAIVLALLFFLAPAPVIGAIVGRGTRILYIHDGELHEDLFLMRQSIRLDEIRTARRDVGPGSNFRNYIVLEAGSPVSHLPPGFYPTPPDKVMMIWTLLYKTSAEEMLERLAAQGVKIKGSKTALLDLPGRR